MASPAFKPKQPRIVSFDGLKIFHLQSWQVQSSISSLRSCLPYRAQDSTPPHHIHSDMSRVQIHKSSYLLRCLQLKVQWLSISANSQGENSSPNECSNFIDQKSTTRYIHDRWRPNLMNIEPNTWPSNCDMGDASSCQFTLTIKRLNLLPSTSMNTKDRSKSNLTVILTPFLHKHLLYNQSPYLSRSVYTTTKHLRRFFSEYAVSRRVSHNHMHHTHALVSIKDFSYLNVFSLLNPGNVGQNSEIALV